MAKISNLKDKQGNVLYPITSISALVDSNGQQFQPAKQGDSYTKSESDGKYVALAGTQTITGSKYFNINLNLRNQSFTRGTAPSESIWRGLAIVDSGNNRTAMLEQLIDTNLNAYTYLRTYGVSPAGSASGNTGAYVRVDGNNDKSGVVSLVAYDANGTPKSFSFDSKGVAWIDGHKAITDETIKTVRTWQVGYNSANSSKGWYKFLTFNWNGTETYANYDMHILVSSTYANYFSGVLHLNPRWDTAALASGMCVEWDWIGGNKQFTADSVKVVRSNNKIECYIYQPIDSGWHFISFSILHESRRLYSGGISYAFATVDTAPLSSVSNVWITSTKAGNGEDFQLDTEVMTNTKWIDGKPIYKLTKYFEDLPNSSSWSNVFYLHSDATISQIIKIEGILDEWGNLISLPVGEGGAYRNLRWNRNTGYIQTINNGFNHSAYITVYFTRK